MRICWNSTRRRERDVDAYLAGEPIDIDEDEREVVEE